MFKGVFKSVTKNERGVGLIEVLVALAILGIIAVAFLTGLATTAKAVVIADVRTTAESLARTQMEDIKDQDYDTAPDNSVAYYDKIDAADIPDGFSIWSVNRNGNTVNGGNDDDIIAVPWDSDPLVDQPVPTDVGLQRIKLVIKFNGEVKITLEGYKVNR